MKSFINTSKIARTLAFTAVLFVIAGTAFASAPAKAHATNILDPFCLWSGCGSSHSSSVSNISAVRNTTYYNTNSNVNSPGGRVTTNTSNTTVTGNTVATTPVTPIIINNPAPTTPAPIYTYNYGTYPTTYYGDSPTYYGGQTSTLTGSCYPLTSSTNAGNSTVWVASASGGTGNYTYTWSGTDGLSGYGTSLTFTYYSPGTKVANVTINSGSRSIAIPCSQSVIVNGNTYDYNNSYNSYNNYNSGYGYSYYNNSVYVTCSPNTSNTSVGVNVIWNSNVSGGNGAYTYQWTGTDGIYGSGSTVGAIYTVPGTKNASLTVYSSNGQSATAQCSPSVSVANTYNTYTNYNYNNNNNGIVAACAADAAVVRPGTTVTWAVEATGATGNFSYSWSGTNGLSGSVSSAPMAYYTTGQKSASVTVTSSDGRSVVKSCGTVAVRNPSTGVNTNVTNVNSTNNPNNNAGLTGNSFFSLGNIPWGWVAILVILVLFATVLYLLFNKNKI
jgi:hypothetical protein